MNKIIRFVALHTTSSLHTLFEQLGRLIVSLFWWFYEPIESKTGIFSYKNNSLYFIIVYDNVDETCYNSIMHLKTLHKYLISVHKKSTLISFTTIRLIKLRRICMLSHLRPTTNSPKYTFDINGVFYGYWIHKMYNLVSFAFFI